MAYKHPHNKMKKIGITVLLIIGVISTVTGVIALYSLKSHVPSSTAIIGGADIPTAVFMAGKVGALFCGAIIAGVFLVIIGIL